MAMYHAGASPAAANSAATHFTFHTNGRRARISDIMITTTTAVATSVGIGQAANNATPPVASTSVTPSAMDFNTTAPDPAAVSRLDTAWSTAPTVPSPFWRKFTLAATIGSGVIIGRGEPERMILGQTTAQWMTFWNHGGSAGAALDCYVVYDE